MTVGSVSRWQHSAFFSVNFLCAWNKVLRTQVLNWNYNSALASQLLLCVLPDFHTSATEINKPLWWFTIVNIQRPIWAITRPRPFVRIFLQLSTKGLHCDTGQPFLKLWYRVLKVYATLTHRFPNTSNNKQNKKRGIKMEEEGNICCQPDYFENLV
jgi:hypothetical protein